MKRRKLKLFESMTSAQIWVDANTASISIIDCRVFTAGASHQGYSPSFREAVSIIYEDFEDTPSA
jgi:hypothetical protein